MTTKEYVDSLVMSKESYQMLQLLREAADVLKYNSFDMDGEWLDKSKSAKLYEKIAIFLSDIPVEYDN